MNEDEDRVEYAEQNNRCASVARCAEPLPRYVAAPAMALNRALRGVTDGVAIGMGRLLPHAGARPVAVVPLGARRPAPWSIARSAPPGRGRREDGYW